MRNWLLSLLALFAAIGVMQPVQTAAETAFYTKMALTHEDDTTTQPYAMNEQMNIQLSWTYDEAAPAVFTLPDIFKVSENIEKELLTKEGDTIGTLTVNEATNAVTAVFENAESGAAGTTVIPVSFNQENVTKAGTYSVTFPTGETMTLTVTDAGAGAIKVVALDADTKVKLAGSVFTVVNESGKVVASFTTNTAGEASVPNLEFGTYTVTQTAAPDGYAVPADPWEIELNTVLVTKEILHEKATGLTGALNITAVEKSTTAPIAGAEFELKTESGLFSKKVVTDEKGKASLTGLSYGTYILTQTKTDTDYVLPTDSWTITIGRQTPIEQKIENALVNAYGALTVTLTDSSSSTVLKGAEYSLYDEAEKLVSKVVTDDKGIASFKNLTAGSYTLEETDAPDGYTRSTDETAVTIKSGETFELKLENTKIAAASSRSTTTKAAGTLPQTGDESGMMYMFGGVLLAAGALLLMRKGKRA